MDDGDIGGGKLIGIVDAVVMVAPMGDGILKIMMVWYLLAAVLEGHMT